MRDRPIYTEYMNIHEKLQSDNNISHIVAYRDDFWFKDRLISPFYASLKR